MKSERSANSAIAYCFVVGISILLLFSDPANAADPQPVGPSGAWSLKFHDEFEGNAVDTTKWNWKFFYSPVVANAFMSPDEISVSNGALHLKIEEKAAGTATNNTARSYTGSMANTYNKFRFIYGVVEMRAKIPGNGPGEDSGLMLIDDSGNGHDVWPPEIDLVEILSQSPKMAVMTYHWRQDGVHKNASNWFKRLDTDFSTGFHVFTVDWEPDAIKWYIDGNLRFTYSNAAEITGLPLYLVIVPGVCSGTKGWCHGPTGATTMPAQMDVDYVRVWQK